MLNALFPPSVAVSQSGCDTVMFITHREHFRNTDSAREKRTTTLSGEEAKDSIMAIELSSNFRFSTTQRKLLLSMVTRSMVILLWSTSYTETLM